ncbi:6536_t:CDS:2 [Dentiscutata heterogama]|uniref:6536_t:CDS:1 n=1 Tax=Dentiscutata heterogama TaxID=1316150 RepID=A0ACA9KZQ2_9GLOM|nr:6536_t:CDS:2 [Dentiscutata heterogama]
MPELNFYLEIKNRLFKKENFLNEIKKFVLGYVLVVGNKNFLKRLIKMYINSSQDESQEYLVDILISSNDENNNNDSIFDFEQVLYEQALVLTELENDLWKEFNAKDISVLQKINYEKTGGKFIKEIPSVKAKLITSYNLLKYSPSHWLAMRNPVVVKFINTLTYNENEDHYEGEKLFKCAIAIDIIYGIRHLKYVSAANLALSAIKYSIAKSKTIIDIDSYIISSGSFTKFIKWQENLAGNPELFPNGLVFMAFDNEQKGQKNYLDRGHNKVTFHTVTSFVLFNFNPNNQIQNFESPWLNQNLDASQIEKLFGLTSEMQILLDRQLHDYLLTIITELSKEKSENINVIDNLVINQSAKTNNQKQCRECGKNEIENSKRKCPQCNAKLPTLAETQQENEQTISDKKDSSVANF